LKGEERRAAAGSTSSQANAGMQGGIAPLSSHQLMLAGAHGGGNPVR